MRELVAYYSNRLSYQEVENLVERVTGQRILSDQKIWEIVINQAGEISAQWQEQINKINSLMTKEIEISPTVDIYNSEQEEILLFLNPQGITIILDWYHLCKKIREKHKGMSWRALGSRALAILKIAELNVHWQQIWFPQSA